VAELTGGLFLDRLLAACPLTPYVGEAKTCRWCAVSLTGRKVSWCGKDHVQAYRENHDFSTGRFAVLARDRWTCVRCGAMAFDEPCDRVLYPQYGGHFWDREGDRMLRAVVQLEVNHRIPVRGGKRSVSCANHLGNLESLCRSCHNVETRLQILSTRSCENPHRTIACWEGLHEQCWSTWTPGTVGPELGWGWTVAGCTCPCHGFALPERTLFDLGAVHG
jgi:HNH endonuclease